MLEHQNFAGYTPEFVSSIREGKYSLATPNSRWAAPAGTSPIGQGYTGQYILKQIDTSLPDPATRAWLNHRSQSLGFVDPRLKGVGLWPFTNGLTTETLTPLGELNSVIGQSLYASANVPVYGPGYIAATGNVVANVSANHPLGVITDYGTDKDGVLWWYLEVSGTGFEYVGIGKLLGGHVYVQDDPSVTFSTGPTPSTGAEVGAAAGGAASSALGGFFSSGGAGVLLVLGAVGFLMLGGPRLFARQSNPRRQLRIRRKYRLPRLHRRLG